MPTIQEILTAKNSDVLERITHPERFESKQAKPKKQLSSIARDAMRDPILWAQTVEFHIYDFPYGKELESDVFLARVKSAWRKSSTNFKYKGTLSLETFGLSSEACALDFDVLLHALRTHYSNYERLLLIAEELRHTIHYTNVKLILRKRFDALIQEKCIALAEQASLVKRPVRTQQQRTRLEEAAQIFGF